MALPINIEELIHQRTVEQTRIEYKNAWNPEPILHTITAFANDYDNMGGGYILVGVTEEDGRPKFPIDGIEPTALDKIQQDILNKCNLIEPRYIPVIEPATYRGKNIIILWAPGGENRPYTCPDKIYTEKGAQKSPRSYWLRKGSRTLKANRSEERELIGMTRNIPFDDRINYHASVMDLRLALMAEYLHDVNSELYKESMNRSAEAVGTDMQIVRGPSEYRKPLNVGLMFFNERPDSFFPYARIEVVDKPDPTGHGMTEKIFTGPLHKQLSDALSYIKNYILKEYITKVPDSAAAIRVFNWPYQAVEEALSNAVYHRSYQIHEPITVTITPEKLEILSLPGPDRSILDQDLSRGILISRRYRNRRIGDFLKELKMIEGRNTGIPLIKAALKSNGSGEAMFRTDEERSYFLVTLPVHPVFLQKEQMNQTQTAPRKSSRKSRQELKELIKNKLHQQGPLSMNELSATMGYAKLTDTVRRLIHEMLANGEVTYLYPNKPKARNQKICLVSQ